MIQLVADNVGLVEAEVEAGIVELVAVAAGTEGLTAVATELVVAGAELVAVESVVVGLGAD